jgi:hypothetical protein
MPRPRALSVLLGVVALSLTPASAAARTATGTIAAPAISADGSDVTAQVTMGASCAPGEFCAFYPTVTTVEGNRPCAPAITGSSWVGDNVFAEPGHSTIPVKSFTATWSEYPALYTGPKTACLYAETGDELVAQLAYVVPAPGHAPPVPTVAPTPTAPPATTKPVTSPVRYAWRVKGSRLTLTQLAISQVPAQATITARCSGPRCPFARKRFQRSGGAFNLLAALGSRRVFRAGSTFAVEIAAPGRKAKVVRFHLHRGKIPRPS